MAEILRYINTDSSPGGDGTTNLTTGTTRAYASLNEYEANEQQDYVSAGDFGTGLFDAPSGIDDTTQTVFSGSTTGAGNDITIKPNTGQKALKTGIDESIYKLESAATSTLQILDDYINILGMQIGNTEGSAGSRAVQIGDSEGFLFDSCYVELEGDGSGFIVNGSTADGKIQNTIIRDPGGPIGGTSEGVLVQNALMLLIVNSLIDGFNDGIERDAGNVDSLNNVMINNTTNFDGVITIDYCMTSAGEGSNPQTPLGGDFSNEYPNYLTGNYTAISTGNLPNGIGPSVNVNVPLFDIEEDVRSGASTYIGPDQIVDVTGISIPVVIYHLRNQGVS